jgi:hypothetical protein
MNIGDVKPGMKLRVEGGFGCMKRGAEVIVKVDEQGFPFVPCRRGGHWLAGQVGEGGELIGFSPCPA